MLPFEGVRVIEVAAWTFVPAVGAALADLGAALRRAVFVPGKKSDQAIGVPVRKAALPIIKTFPSHFRAQSYVRPADALN